MRASQPHFPLWRLYDASDALLVCVFFVSWQSRLDKNNKRENATSDALCQLIARSRQFLFIFDCSSYIWIRRENNAVSIASDEGERAEKIYWWLVYSDRWSIYLLICSHRFFWLNIAHFPLLLCGSHWVKTREKRFYATCREKRERKIERAREREKQSEKKYISNRSRLMGHIRRPNSFKILLLQAADFAPKNLISLAIFPTQLQKQCLTTNNTKEELISIQDRLVRSPIQTIPSSAITKMNKKIRRQLG